MEKNNEIIVSIRQQAVTILYHVCMSVFQFRRMNVSMDSRAIIIYVFQQIA